MGPSLNYVFNSVSETEAETEGFYSPPASLTDTLEEVVKSCREEFMLYLCAAVYTGRLKKEKTFNGIIIKQP